MLDFTPREVKVSIRERLPDDPEGFPAYVVWNPITEKLWVTFGMVNGGNTREEVLFWAKRFSSKNGLPLELPEGWEDVEAALPERSWREKDG